jgi:hypothetical protein
VQGSEDREAEKRVQGGDCHMPAHYHIDAERRLVTVKFDGQLRAHDIVQYLERLAADPAFDSEFAELADLTRVTDAEVDFQAAMMIARDKDPFSRKAMRAFVVPTADTLEKVRMYQMARGNDGSITVFPTREEARRWLGLGKPKEEVDG